jgi:cell division protein FtsB
MAPGERGGWLDGSLSPGRILLIAVLFLVAYFGVSIVANAITRYELMREQDRLRRDIADLLAQQRRLDALRAYMQTDEFIERAAREQGLVRPGDTAVVVAAPTPAATATPAPGAPWWERYFAPQPR